MSEALVRVTVGGKLSEQLEPLMKARAQSADSQSQALAEAWTNRGTSARGRGIQSKVLLTNELAKLLIEDINEIWELHNPKGESKLPAESRNRLIFIQANRTRKQLVTAVG